MPATAGLRAFDPQRMRLTADWRRREGVPRHVFVHASNDTKPYYLDFESSWFLELFERRRAESPAGVVHVTEMLPGPDEMWVRDSDGRYATEFLVHLRSF
jgi:hypothetical protein